MENLLESPVERRHRVETVFICKVGNALFAELGVGYLLRYIAHSHAVYIVVQAFAQVGIEEL